MHAAVRHGTPSLTSLPKDSEVHHEVRPPSSPNFGGNSNELQWILQKDLDRAIFLYNFIHEVRSSGVTA